VLRRSLDEHVPADDAEARDLEHLRAFVARHPRPFDRSLREGHLTASALVVAARGTHVLLLWHRKLERWLQPGGHGDPGETTGEAVALREAAEETGVHGLTLHPTAPRPLDVDVHAIPARDHEPAHAHLDLRYVLAAPPDATLRRAVAECDELRWFAWVELPSLGLDPGLQRALAKVRALTA